MIKRSNKREKDVLFWFQVENQRAFLDSVAPKLKVAKYEHWYGVRAGALQEHGAFAVVSIFGGSIVKVLETAVPEYDWKPWLFYSAQKSWWASIRNQRLFAEQWLASGLNIKQKSDWYAISTQQIMAAASDTDPAHNKNNSQSRNNSMTVIGRRLMKRYEFKISRMLSEVFPEHYWNTWAFERKQTRFAEQFTIEQQRGMVEKIGKVLGIPPLLAYNNHKLPSTTLPVFITPNNNLLPDAINNVGSAQSMWYSVSVKDFVNAGSNLGGRWLARNYSFSLYHLLETCYPTYSWLPWKFKHQMNIWNDPKLVQHYVEWLASQLGVVELDQWYMVQQKQVEALGGIRLIRKFGGLIPLLSEVYPNYKWDVARYSEFNYYGKKTQHLIATMLEQLLPPHTKIYTDYRIPWTEQLQNQQQQQRQQQQQQQQQERPTQHLQQVGDHIASTHHAAWLEVDIYIPSYSVAIEYQGEYHYSPFIRATTPLSAMESKVDTHHDNSNSSSSSNKNTSHRKAMFVESVSSIQARDEWKQNTCHTVLGITLIQIPFTWDKSYKSLSSIIQNYRPDIKLRMPT